MSKAPTLSFDSVVNALRKRDFAVLSTVSEKGRPYAAGINYGVSLPGAPFGIYLMTRRHLKKVRNIIENPNVSLVVAITRRLLWFLPPPTIDVQGTAEKLDWKDEVGTRTFETLRSWKQELPSTKSTATYPATNWQRGSTIKSWSTGPRRHRPRQSQPRAPAPRNDGTDSGQYVSTN